MDTTTINKIQYEVIETRTPDSIEGQLPRVAAHMRAEGITSETFLRRPNGKHVYRIQHFANGNDSGLAKIF